MTLWPLSLNPKARTHAQVPKPRLNVLFLNDLCLICLLASRVDINCMWLIGIYTYLFPYLLFCGLSIVMLLLYHILLKHQSCCAASVECCGSESSKSWSIHRCRLQRQTAMKSNWGCSIIIVWCLPADKSTTLYALDAEFRDPNARYHGAINTYSANRMKFRQFDWWPFCFASGVPRMTV